jgi:hypothetical protein
VEIRVFLLAQAKSFCLIDKASQLNSIERYNISDSERQCAAPQERL